MFSQLAVELKPLEVAPIPLDIKNLPFVMGDSDGKTGLKDKVCALYP